MSRRILLVAALPDDEASGGTIARLALSGDKLEALLLPNGVGATGETDIAGASRCRCAVRIGAQCIDVAEPTLMNFSDIQLDALPLLAIIKAIECDAGWSPDIIFTYYLGDLNIGYRTNCASDDNPPPACSGKLMK